MAISPVTDGVLVVELDRGAENQRWPSSSSAQPVTYSFQTPR